MTVEVAGTHKFDDNGASFLPIEDVRRLLAELVVAERERCAKIAENEFNDSLLSEEFVNELPIGAMTGGEVGRVIAAKIRSAQ